MDSSDDERARGGEADSRTAAAPSAQARAHEMRATIGARRDAEAMLAEAGELRRRAADEADALIAEAQRVSQALVDESTEQAEQHRAASAERATDQAEAMLAAARSEAAETAEQAEAAAAELLADAEHRADEHRARVRAELAAEQRRELAGVRERSAALLDAAEARVVALQQQLHAGVAAVGGLLDELTALRSSAVDALPAVDAVDAAAESVVEVDPEGGSFYDGADDAPVTAFVPAVAPPTSAFDVPAEAPDAAHPAIAEVPEPSVASFAELPEPSVASFAEVPRAELPVSAFAEPSPESRPEPTDGLVAAARAAQSTPAGDDTTNRVSDRNDDPADPEPPSRPLGWLFRSAQ